MSVRASERDTQRKKYTQTETFNATCTDFKRNVHSHICMFTQRCSQPRLPIYTETPIYREIEIRVEEPERDRGWVSRNG